MFYTYAHTKQDGTIFYIGKGKGYRAQATCHRNKHWKNIVAKEGLNVQILAEWKDEQEAFEHEKLLIACFRDMRYKLANYSNGGEGPTGNKHSETTKNKMRIAKKNGSHNSRPIEICGVKFQSITNFAKFVNKMPIWIKKCVDNNRVEKLEEYYRNAIKT